MTERYLQNNFHCLYLQLAEGSSLDMQEQEMPTTVGRRIGGFTLLVKLQTAFTRCVICIKHGTFLRSKHKDLH